MIIFISNIIEVWNQEALNNAVLVWLTVFKGEIVRQPETGGLLVSLLTKPMSEENRENIENELRYELEESFNPALMIESINVTPDYIERKWVIEVSGYSPTYKIPFSLEESIKNLI